MISYTHSQLTIEKDVYLVLQIKNQTENFDSQMNVV